MEVEESKEVEHSKFQIDEDRIFVINEASVLFEESITEVVYDDSGSVMSFEEKHAIILSNYNKKVERHQLSFLKSASLSIYDKVEVDMEVYMQE